MYQHIANALHHDGQIPAADLLDIPLTTHERRVLSNGINEWGGPARCTEELAVAMGYDTVADIFRQTPRLHAAIEASNR